MFVGCCCRTFCLCPLSLFSIAHERTLSLDHSCFLDAHLVVSTRAETFSPSEQILDFLFNFTSDNNKNKNTNAVKILCCQLWLRSESGSNVAGSIPWSSRSHFELSLARHCYSCGAAAGCRVRLVQTGTCGNIQARGGACRAAGDMTYKLCSGTRREHVGTRQEHVTNASGTRLEHVGNVSGTCGNASGTRWEHLSNTSGTRR